MNNLIYFDIVVQFKFSDNKNSAVLRFKNEQTKKMTSSEVACCTEGY